MRKFINSLIISSLLFGNIAFAQDSLPKGVPEKFRNYKTVGEKVLDLGFFYCGQWFRSVKYIINSDWPNVTELYQCIETRDGYPLKFSKIPLIRWFDINGNQNHEDNEIFPDKRGLNNLSEDVDSAKKI